MAVNFPKLLKRSRDRQMRFFFATALPGPARGMYGRPTDCCHVRRARRSLVLKQLVPLTDRAAPRAPPVRRRNR
jgi:hypothetical protein